MIKFDQKSIFCLSYVLSVFQDAVYYKYFSCKNHHTKKNKTKTCKGSVHISMDDAICKTDVLLFSP